MSATISKVPGYRPVGHPANDSRNSCGSTARPNSEITPSANSLASIRPVSNFRTDSDCSHMRQSSSVVTALPSHSSMVSTPLSCTSTPPTSNSNTRMCSGGPLIFILRNGTTIPSRSERTCRPDRKHTPTGPDVRLPGPALRLPEYVGKPRSVQVRGSTEGNRGAYNHWNMPLPHHHSNNTAPQPFPQQPGIP